MQGGKRGPRLLVEPAGCRAESSPDHWLAAWRIRNLSRQPLELVEAWAPHGRFRAAARPLGPDLKLLPGESASLELTVTCREPPGTVVENAFLILRLLWRDRPWRLFARHRVIFDEAGAPEPVCEVVTSQPIGFAAEVEG